MKTHRFKDSMEVERRYLPMLDAWLRDSGYVFREATRSEQLAGADRILVEDGDGDRDVGVDYKCDERAGKTRNVFVEIVSSSKTGALGWAVKDSRSKWIIYLVAPDVVIVFLLADVRAAIPEWTRTCKQRQAANQGYVTVGLCVPIALAERAATNVAYLSKGDGAFLQTWDATEGTPHGD